MAIPKLRDLDSYVKRGGRKCRICLSDHRAFTEQAYEADYNLATIIRYLNNQFNAGLPVNAVRRHFREGHHETKANTKRT